MKNSVKNGLIKCIRWVKSLNKSLDEVFFATNTRIPLRKYF